ncbi:hypothetical protein VTI74DRAFT_4918 [Chaetomium olivicolor]
MLPAFWERRRSVQSQAPPQPEICPLRVAWSRCTSGANAQQPRQYLPCTSILVSKFQAFTISRRRPWGEATTEKAGYLLVNTTHNSTQSQGPTRKITFVLQQAHFCLMAESPDEWQPRCRALRSLQDDLPITCDWAPSLGNILLGKLHARSGLHSGFPRASQNLPL